MATIIYKPQPGEPDSVKWNGRTFEKGKAVKLEDPAMLAKAKGNPAFDVQMSKDEQREAEVVGNYRDPLAGQEVTLVRQAPAAAYLGAAQESGEEGPRPPSPATQGSSQNLTDSPYDTAQAKAISAQKNAAKK